MPQTNVILSNLLRSFYGVWNHFNPKQVYCFLSRYWLQVAKQNGNLDRILLGSIWHEFLHSIINPLTDQLFEDPSEIDEKYLDWYCRLNESIIWAITLRLLIKTKIVDTNNCDWYFKNAERNRAPKAEAMHNLLWEYESQQNDFRSIREFYPVLQKEFGEVPN